jgi:two-component system sensor histidine kinase DctS
VAQTLLVVLAVKYENTRAQDETDTLATETAAELRRDLLGQMQALQVLAFAEAPAAAWREGATALLRKRQGLWRVERRSAQGAVLDAVDTPFAPPLFSAAARRHGRGGRPAGSAAAMAAPMFSRSYFVPLTSGQGVEVMDLCVPVQQAGQRRLPWWAPWPAAAAGRPCCGAQRRAAARALASSRATAPGWRAPAVRGAGVYVAERVVDLPGAAAVARGRAPAGPA